NRKVWRQSRISLSHFCRGSAEARDSADCNALFASHGLAGAVPVLEAAAAGRQGRATSVIAKMNKPLTEVFSAVKPGDCTWAIFNPVDDILPIMQEAFADPSRQSRDGLFVAMLVIENENSTHSRSLHEKMSLDPRSRHPAVSDWRNVRCIGRCRYWNFPPTVGTANADP